MENKKTALISSGVIISIVTSISSIVTTVYKGSGTDADVHDSYAILAATVNNLQLQVGITQGRLDELSQRSVAIPECSSPKQASRISSKSDASTAKSAEPKDSDADSSSPSEPEAPDTEANLVWVEPPEPEVSARAKLPDDLDTALQQHRDAK